MHACTGCICRQTEARTHIIMQRSSPLTRTSMLSTGTGTSCGVIARHASATSSAVAPIFPPPHSPSKHQQNDRAECAAGTYAMRSPSVARLSGPLTYPESPVLLHSGVFFKLREGLHKMSWGLFLKLSSTCVLKSPTQNRAMQSFPAMGSAEH